METRVFIVFPPVRGGPGRINDLAAAFAQKVLPNVAIARGVPKKEGAGGLSSGLSFLAACGLGGRGIGRRARHPAIAELRACCVLGAIIG
jgi:hypothetical protein